MADDPTNRGSAGQQTLTFLRFLGKLALLLAGIFAFGFAVFWLRGAMHR